MDIKIVTLTLYRFGGELTITTYADCIEYAKTLLMNDYETMFININGYSSKTEICEYSYNNETYYDNALSDIEITEHTINTVEFK